ADQLRRQLGLHQALQADDQALGPAEYPGTSLDEPPEASGVPSGPVIPGYEILGELGRGGTGVVYKARQKSLHRLVALKVLRSGAAPAAEERARLHAEARAVARLRHPHIIQVYEVGEAGDRAYLAL